MIGVVIQGPLITFGQGPNNSKEGFNTFQTIIQNIESIEKLGFQYILSTWKPSNKREEAVAVQLSDAEVNMIALDSPSVSDPDHRYKHHYGIQKGVEKIDQDVDYIIKIRTDQLYKKDFWSFMVSIAKKDTEKLCISELYHEPFFMGDFVYAGKRSVIEKFITGFLGYKSKNYHPCLAMDIGIKYCNISKFRKFPVFFPSFVYFIFMPNYTRNLWNDFINDYIVVIPESIRNGILWRGVPIGKIITCNLFRFDTSPIERNINILARLFNYIRHIRIYLFKAYPKIPKKLKSIKK